MKAQVPTGAKRRPQSGKTTVVLPTNETLAPNAPLKVTPSTGPFGLLLRGVIIVGFVVGLALRLWYVFHTPVNADEATVGLMVHQILHGHFFAFYWGQVYGGVEPYIVAPIQLLIRSPVWALKLTPILLSAVASGLIWRIAKRLVRDPNIALLPAAIVWVAPQASILNSTLEYGFRGVTMVCGLALVLVALRILDGSRGLVSFVELGLAAGVGWWSSAEIAYFGLPAAILLVMAYVRDDEIGASKEWVKRLAVAAAVFVVGALPWLWENVNTGFASLKPGSFASIPPDAPSYLGRLRIFAEYMLPMLFSLRAQRTGDWTLGLPLGLLVLTLLIVLVLGAAVLCVLRGGRSTALAVGVIGFPFLMALNPATWYWEDGRYDGYLFPLVVLVVLVGCTEAARRFRRGVLTVARQDRIRIVSLAGVTVAIMCLTAASFVRFAAPGGAFFSGWTSNPDAPTDQAIHDLEAHGVKDGYADYWVAYRLDLLSNERLVFTTVSPVDSRWKVLDSIVKKAKHQSWVFVTTPVRGVEQFCANTFTRNPDAGLSRSSFINRIGQLGIHYRTINVGLARAVVPQRPVSSSVLTFT